SPIWRTMGSPWTQRQTGERGGGHAREGMPSAAAAARGPAQAAAHACGGSEGLVCPEDARSWRPPRRSCVLALAAQRWGVGGGVAREKRVPLALVLGDLPERPGHFSEIPAPRAGQRGHMRGVEPGGNSALGQALLAPA